MCLCFESSTDLWLVWYGGTLSPEFCLVREETCEPKETSSQIETRTLTALFRIEMLSIKVCNKRHSKRARKGSFKVTLVNKWSVLMLTEFEWPLAHSTTWEIGEDKEKRLIDGISRCNNSERRERDRTGGRSSRHRNYSFCHTVTCGGTRCRSRRTGRLGFV